MDQVQRLVLVGHSMFEIIHSELHSFLLVYDVMNDDDHYHLDDFVCREKRSIEIIMENSFRKKLLS